MTPPDLTGQGTSSNLGTNGDPVTLCGDSVLSVFNPDANSVPTYDLAAIIGALVTAGAAFVDGTPVTATNVQITQLDLALKPIGGHIADVVTGSQQTTTTSHATMTNNGNDSDLDPGGSVHDIFPQPDFTVAIDAGSGIRLVLDYEQI